MAGTDSERFDILFAGECLDGHEEAVVRTAVARLFRADDATLDRLFSGRRQRIKRGVDAATARRYAEAMAAAGARAIVQPCGDAADPGDTADAAPEAAVAPVAQADSLSSGATATGATTLEVSPAGSDILRPEERRRHAAAAPDVSPLSLAAAGTDLGDAVAPVAAPPAAGDFSLAEAGADLGVPRTANAPPAPDTSAITLAPPDHDLGDGIPTAGPATTPETTGLSLAEAGSDLLRDEERRRDTADAPDTSHLALKDEP